MPARKITDGGMAKKWSQMVLAMRVDRYLPDHDQFIVTFASIGECLQNSSRVLLIAAGPMRPGAADTAWCFNQPLACRVFSDRVQQPLPIGYAKFRVI